MASFENKKLALLRIFQILEKYSDENHCLTQKDISNYLSNQYQIQIERKTVARNISLLREAGIEIIEKPHKGIYLSTRKFKDSELLFLIDFVLHFKQIGYENAKKIVDQLCEMSSKHALNSSKYNYILWDSFDKEKSGYLEILEKIQKAIQNKQKIEFEYSCFNKTNQVKIKRIVEPLSLVYKAPNYYLVGKNEKNGLGADYDIHFISNVKIIDQIQENINQIFTSNHLLKVQMYVKERIMNDIINTFGKEVKIEKILGKKEKKGKYDEYFSNFFISVTVKTSFEEAEEFLLKNLGNAIVISPAKLQKRIHNLVKEAHDIYNELEKKEKEI